MQQEEDEQGRTIVTVMAVGRFGPAVERKCRERARADAYRIGYTRIRKLRTIEEPDRTTLRYVAYRPLNQRGQE